MKNLGRLSFLLAILILASCKTGSKTTEQEVKIVKPNVPEWHKNATIYEVNLRHYTPEGTFKAFEEHLPRLKDMGIDILWLMPIHEISKTKRKGELGSPYAVNDYYGVNPDFGTMNDFESLLKAIHNEGMYCIIDWVPNHTGWDNPWITEHPDWYTKNKDGEITDPLNPGTGESWGWTDVADLNYDIPEMRLGMIDAMRFWIEDIGIDGFRVDVAHSVPADFWNQCSDSLYAVKPIFMLAEAEVPEFVNSGDFVMDYAWEMHHLLNDIAKSQNATSNSTQKLVQGNLVEGEAGTVHVKNAKDIDALLEKYNQRYDKGYKMHFTSNHDENAWAGTEFERMGDAHLTFAVLTATFDGMPLVYTGQESAMDKQLEFFTKDEIPWGDFKYHDFYKTLFKLKHRNQALWNGAFGGKLKKIVTSDDKKIYAFSREKNGDKVVVILNLSSSTINFTLNSGNFVGNYNNVFNSDEIALTENMTMEMKPWEYLVLEGK